MEARWFRDHQREPSRTWVLTRPTPSARPAHHVPIRGAQAGDHRSRHDRLPDLGDARRWAGGGRFQDWQSCGHGFESRQLHQGRLAVSQETVPDLERGYL